MRFSATARDALVLDTSKNNSDSMLLFDLSSWIKHATDTRSCRVYFDGCNEQPLFSARRSRIVIDRSLDRARHGAHGPFGEQLKHMTLRKQSEHERYKGNWRKESWTSAHASACILWKSVYVGDGSTEPHCFACKLAELNKYSADKFP